MSNFQGLRSAQGKVKKITPPTLVWTAVKTGQTRPADGKRRKTTGSPPAVGRKRRTPSRQEETETGRHDRFVAYARRLDKLNQWRVCWSKLPTQQRVQSRGPKTGQGENPTQTSKASKLAAEEETIKTPKLNTYSRLPKTTVNGRNGGETKTGG